MTENSRAKDRWLARPPLKAQPAEMNAQELWQDGQESMLDVRDSLASRIVGVALLLTTAVATSIFAAALYTALALHNDSTPLHYLFLGLSTFTFSWVAFGAANAFVGICALAAGTEGNSMSPAPAEIPH